MKVLLVYKAHAAGAGDPYTSLLPVGLGYINSLLRRHGIGSRLANLSTFSWPEIEALLGAERPDIIGITQFTHNRFESLQLAALAKKVNPAGLVVLGGTHATHRHAEILREHAAVDVVVLGEGEETFLELARTLEEKGGAHLAAVPGIALRQGGEVLQTLPRAPIADLDSLPLPAAYADDAIGVDLRRQFEFLITSRGCPASCSFCSSPRFWGRTLRFRSPRSMVDEVRYLRDHFGLIYFSIRDDTFTADKGRVIDFCRLLLEERIYILWNCQSRVTSVDQEMLWWMKRAGCECVQYGVESGSAAVLKMLGKRITAGQAMAAARATRESGLNLSIYLITGVPGEGVEELQATLRLIERLRPHDGQVSPLAYYPGTALFEEGVKAGRIPPDLFETAQEEAFYARNDPFVARSTAAILAQLVKTARNSRYTAKDFAIQREFLGYCHATNIMAGEMYEERGELAAALRDYQQVISREPENPWGWLAAGELYLTMGAAGKADKAFRELLRLVPANRTAHEAMAELARLGAGMRGTSAKPQGKRGGGGTD